MYALKESGYQYIGLVPIHWKLEKLKYKLKRSENRKVHSSEVLSLYREYGVVPKSSRDDNHNVTSEDTSKYKFVEIGDFVVNKMKAWQGSVAVSQLEGIVSPAYYVYSFIDRSFVKRYFHYLIRSCYKGEFRRLSGGIREGQWDLPSIALDNVSVICPPTEEQEKIANFLDDKCTEIDSLVADIQKEISILEEYKMSVVTESVTKGIKPNVELKNSGLDWINKIPKEWSKSKVKYLFSSGKGLSITKDNLVTEGIPVINYGQIHSKENTRVELSNTLLRYIPKSFIKKATNSQVNQYDFVFADTSEDYDGCGNCVYKRDDSITYAGYHTIVLHSINSTDNRYLAYLFTTDLWREQIRTKVSGIKVLSITQQIILNSSLILPPFEEQKEIADYLDCKCTEIEKVISVKQSQLELLAEYKKSLIYEYVTGKKEVI